MKSAVEQFLEDVERSITDLSTDAALQQHSREWINQVVRHKYTHNFRWLGRPIIQLPQDIVAMQELIWTLQPDLIIETGIAHGGSLILSASLLELNAICGGRADAQVLGVDIDIRAHNRQAIEAHPMARRIRMIQGSSVAPDVVAQVRELASTKQRVVVCLDSNHTHEHVLAELQAYAPLVSVGCYCVVFDTVIEDMDPALFPDRPWKPGNSPKTAVWEYLKTHPEYEIDRRIHERLVLSVAPDGYLKRVRP